jgi:ankyrin repeat protein
MEDALSSLSPNLDSAFEKTIQRIQRLPESRKRLGIEILMWISHAKRPLDVEELSDVLSVKPGQTKLNPKYRPSPSIMLDCCQGLVTIDPKAARIHLAHYSIQEYLVKHSESLFPDAETNLGTTSLTYLISGDFRTGPLRVETDIQHRIGEHPFSTYAAQFWGVHMRGADLNERIKDLILSYLNSQEAIGSSIQILEFHRRHGEVYWNAEECMSHTALHICSRFGLDELLLDLLDQVNLSINTGTEMGTTTIINAASRGFISTVKILLDRGADPYLENWYGNALHCAAEAGNSATIRELLAYGMSPNACKRYHRSPLSCTIEHDHADAFETLISLGADINGLYWDSTSRGELPPILHQVVAYDALNIMDMALKHRWGDLEQKTNEGHTALHYAADAGNSLMWQKLIEAGAKLDVKDGSGFTPQHYLAREKLYFLQEVENIHDHDGECVHSWE